MSTSIIAAARAHVVWTLLWLTAVAACGFPKPADLPVCATPADCKTPSAPFCIAGACVAACASNADCQAESATPLCKATTGACVACLDGTVCTADKPVCDATTSVCRGCSRDDECSGGICLAADGTCVSDGDVAFVDSLAGRDTGACTRDVPCQTLPFAISQIAATHDHIQVKILSGSFLLSTSVSLFRQLYLEGNGTIIAGPPGMFSLLQGANVTLGHLKLQPSSAGAVVTVDSGKTLRLFDVQTTGSVTVTGGGLDAEQSSFSNAGGISCTAGTLTVSQSAFADSPLTTMTCAVTVRRTRFDFSSDSNKLDLESGPLTFENNLLVQTDGIADTMTTVGLSPDSTVRFNTFVNTTALPSDGVALSCSSPINVTSNVFAYSSMDPIAGCDVRYSLFDGVALPKYSTGIGSKQADASTFFVDRTGNDFHLSPASPARGAAEPGLPVANDFDGASRPSPAGSRPDMGAFEAN